MSIQAKRSGWVTAGAAITLTLDAAPDAGSTLIAILTTEGATASTIDTAGWSQLRAASSTTGTTWGIQLYSAAGTAGDTVHVAVGGGGTNRHLAIYEVADAIEDSDVILNGTFPSSGIGTISGPALTQVEEAGTLIAGFAGANQTYVATAVFTAVSPLVALGAAQRTGRVHAWSGEGPTTAGSWTPQVTVTGLTGNYQTAVVAVILSHDVPASPVADFSGTPTTAEVGQDIQFTDLSSGTPTSWLWDFGDGTTSTSQNPLFGGYAGAGNYSVTLTATNAFGSDSETKVAYISVLVADTLEPPEPAGVLLEIYAASPGAARWDVAKWDQAVWSSSAWQDVTPYGTTVDITWGSSRPNDGILSVPDAASWAVDYYDPGRILDPANEDGPYFGDLIPYLPIRVSHRGTVIRQGFATGISHDYDTDQGFMRGADNITRLANAQVPPDTELADTLYQRAIDAIAAAGLDVQVVIPPGTDPPVSPWVTDTREWSVWQWVKDAAQEVLYIPIIDRLNRLTFRPWASPLLRARSITAPEMIGLTSVTDYEGMYSRILVLNDVATVIERALTPPPRYGARTYERTEPTLNAVDWAEAVLADRSFSTVRWVPGQIYPLTAVSVEQFATIEAVERVTLTHLFTDPTIIKTGVVVGGRITVRPKYDSQDAKWRFTFQVAPSDVTEPLIESGGDPTDYLLATGGVEFLYPST